MNELLGVVRMDDFDEGNDGLGNFATMFSAAAGDGELVRLIPALHGVEDDILLQDAVVAEGGLA